jgi:hypothetical protein
MKQGLNDRKSEKEVSERARTIISLLIACFSLCSLTSLTCVADHLNTSKNNEEEDLTPQYLMALVYRRLDRKWFNESAKFKICLCLPVQDTPVRFFSKKLLVFLVNLLGPGYKLQVYKQLFGAAV